ncbi:MAG TPA: DNA-processing protein DprA [Candidatus Sulfotelmatobacter sp.]|nr:DNA-processing protein DprA [Candidatus Sulfotelmatobacter sp.]
MSETAVSPATTHALEWLALSLTPGLGPTKARKLAEHFGSSEAVFRASLTELESTGIQAVSAQSLATGKSMELAREEMARAADTGVTVVSVAEVAYPPRLKEIYDPPAILYVRGDAELLTRPGIAVVGTRHPTPYGSGMAERLACDLASQGLVIISGMARGVDTASHRGAISAKGKTVAVFGTGVDVIYPKENSRLSEQILALGGALISEFPLGTFAAPQNFPIRNRILSGMSVGVLVVEAAEYSGTRITARLALEQNRDVFAVPGNVTNKNSWGPNTLIKQGAKLVATWEDVWEDLPTEVRLALAKPASPESQTASAASLFPDDGLPPHEKLLLSLLKADEATHIDELVEKLESQMSSSEIFAALFELELTGKVKQMPGKNFVKSF